MKTKNVKMFRFYTKDIADATAHTPRTVRDCIRNGVFDPSDLASLSAWVTIQRLKTWPHVQPEEK